MCNMPDENPARLGSFSTVFFSSFARASPGVGSPRPVISPPAIRVDVDCSAGTKQESGSGCSRPCLPNFTRGTRSIGIGRGGSASLRAPCGGAKTGPNPTDRRKLGSKHHLLTDGRGIPLACTLTKANRHDVTQLLPLLDKVPRVKGQPGAPRCRPQHVQGDRAYDSEPHRKEVKKRG